MKKLLEAVELEYTFQFKLRKVSSIVPVGFKPFFNNLPIDPYIKGKYRSRRLSRLMFAGEELIKLPHGYLYQSQKYNPLLGDIKREFSELEDELVQLDIFQQLVMAFADFCNLHPEAEIGVHQIRTSCSPNNFGNPAPEGIHQDGADFIGIFSVDRDNIQGGQTHLYAARKEKPVFNKILEPGELLLVNDRDFFHFTTPIKPLTASPGTRDVFVLTFPSLISD
jgi:hypothetical protein